MSAPAVIVVWLVLLLLVLAEFLIRGLAAMALGGAAVVIVTLTFMRLARTRNVSQAFALATVFWLLVLMGIGSLDSATRHDIAVPFSSQR